MALGTAYLVAKMFSARMMKQYVREPMLRFIAGLMIYLAIVAHFGPQIKEEMSRRLESKSPATTQASPIAASQPRSEPVPRYSSRAESSKKPTSGTTIIETAPAVGNLDDRANALADEIIADLDQHGWNDPTYRGKVLLKMPESGKALDEWIDIRWGFFRWAFLKRVIEIRDEFSQLHLKDPQLDDVLEQEQDWENSGRDYLLPPQDLPQVAQRLRVLASQLPKR